MPVTDTKLSIDLRRCISRNVSEIKLSFISVQHGVLCYSKENWLCTLLNTVSIQKKKKSFLLAEFKHIVSPLVVDIVS